MSISTGVGQHNERAHAVVDTTATRDWALIALVHAVWAAALVLYLVNIYDHDSNLRCAAAFVSLGTWGLFQPILVATAWRARMRAAMARIEVAAGAYREGTDRYVGVAYGGSDGGLGTPLTWDRGFLWVENGYLCFRGWGPAFRLPLSCIEAIKPPKRPSLFFARGRRVVLAYKDMLGQSRTLRLSPLALGPGGPTHESAKELGAWLEREVAAQPGPGTAGIAWPPTERSDQLDGLPGDTRRGWAWSTSVLGVNAIVLIAISGGQVLRSSPWELSGFTLAPGISLLLDAVAFRYKTRKAERSASTAARPQGEPA